MKKSHGKEPDRGSDNYIETCFHTYDVHKYNIRDGQTSDVGRGWGRGEAEWYGRQGNPRRGVMNILNKKGYPALKNS